MITDYSTLRIEQLHQLKRITDPAAHVAIDAAIARKSAPATKRRPSSVEGDPDVSEKEVQRRINQRLGKLGVAVYWMSQPRKSGQTCGVPDLMCFDPYRGLFFVEVKAHGGAQREAQRLFQERCEAAGVSYVLGGMAEVEEFLKGGVDVDSQGA